MTIRPISPNPLMPTQLAKAQQAIAKQAAVRALQERAEGCESGMPMAVAIKVPLEMVVREVPETLLPSLPTPLPLEPTLVR